MRAPEAASEESFDGVRDHRANPLALEPVVVFDLDEGDLAAASREGPGGVSAVGDGDPLVLVAVNEQQRGFDPLELRAGRSSPEPPRRTGFPMASRRSLSMTATYRV